MNRITVVGGDTINAQARTYAEYRVFAALARHTRSVRRVRVVLRHPDERGICDKVTCVVTVSLEPAGSLRIRVRGPHVYAAINRAVERLGDVLGRRIDPPRSRARRVQGRFARLFDDDGPPGFWWTR